jgi:hypothetical protein
MDAMKIEKHDLIKVDVELVVNKNQEKRYSLIGSYKPRIDGGYVFRYCIETKTIQKAEYKTSDTIKLDGKPSKTLIVKKNSIYVEALNEKNAMKRIKKGNIIFAN